MILNELASWNGDVEINGEKFDNIQDALRRDPSEFSDSMCILLHSANKNSVQTHSGASGEYVVTVRKYMTEKSTPGFDFMEKWNNNVPMPLRTMVGEKVKETRGMVYMKLHGDVYAKVIDRCINCGKILTNPISKYFGMGPECGRHNYINPFESDEELQKAVEEYRKQLQTVTWEGWIVKSAITEMEEIKDE